MSAILDILALARAKFDGSMRLYRRSVGIDHFYPDLIGVLHVPIISGPTPLVKRCQLIFMVA